MINYTNNIFIYQFFFINSIFIIKICAFSSENKTINLVLLFFILIFIKGSAIIVITSKGKSLGTLYWSVLHFTCS